ncbi:unnamed protein product [Haemonchus placei]|uniref:Uncharacterized protein n=1 Tax=Haemonchus placei TaxID=6290 RepID=A0A0N4WWA8_HAEPC|nr:unnamed protein product [Haemonchus placei]
MNFIIRSLRKSCMSSFRIESIQRTAAIPFVATSIFLIGRRLATSST